MSTYIKTTVDGRKVEVIGTTIHLGGKKEADNLVSLREHPNWRAILAAVPMATHMAGRLPLTAAEAALAQSAINEGHRVLDISKEGISKRIQMAPKSMLRLRIDE